MSLYHFPAARTEEQRKYMEQLERDGVCVFCLEYFDRYHQEPIEIDGRYWYVTKNDYPYKGSAVHLLIVPKEHVESLTELPCEAGTELFSLFDKIKRQYSTASEALILRNGDMRFNGGSVAHLHFHFVSGDVDNSDHEPIRFKVSSRDAKNPPSSS